MKLFIIPIIQQTLQEQFTHFLCGGRMFPVYLYRRREQDGIGLLDSAGDGVHKLNHAVQRLLVLSGPLVSLGKEAGTHAVSHAQQLLQLAVNDALRALPGIGDYTAGAVASISFGIPVPAVDGNVLRVFSRLYNDPAAVTEPAVKKAFTARVMEHQPPDAPGDYNQALMELGALVCVPNGAPLCEKCPLAHLCAARAAGTALELPRKAAPKPRRLQPVTLALVESPAGFLLQQRPQKGLLAGLWQPVLWEGEALAAGEVLARLQAMGMDTGTAAPEALPAAKHIFSHIEWHMNGILLHVPAQDAPAGCVWASREALQAEYTLPGAFKAYRKLII